MSTPSMKERLAKRYAAEALYEDDDTVVRFFLNAIADEIADCREPQVFGIPDDASVAVGAWHHELISWLRTEANREGER